MKKICFSERYGLQDAVLERRKIHTRRIIPASTLKKVDDFRLEYYNATLDNLEGKDLLDQYFFIEKIGKLPYQIGEEVAIAQRYASILDELEDPKNYCCMEHWEADASKRARYAGFLEHPGFTNKMFVLPEEMPHTIRFNRVWFEQLQDISDEDCIKEGVAKWTKDKALFKYDLYEGFEMFAWADKPRTPREAYAALINRISGKGTWESNPFVFAYEFELIK